MPFAALPDLSSIETELVALVSQHCRLPNPNVVKRLGGPVFPTIRDQRKRLTLDHENGLMLDDNVSPRWALFWSHGYAQTHHPKGWTIAHVWAAPKDRDAYSNLANLCLMPEALGSLSDKLGPLGPYLKYHAYSVYGWHLKSEAVPEMPEGYEEIRWTYFEEIDDPLAFIHDRLKKLNNQRVKLLRPLMGLDDAQ
ncbi:hypothetical protein IV417_14875 [Alphaproteobacteria bacterium KMM 3653]|uniref:Uncharacterized protein n=1 Tax=Harenicola maris TaxID=2841044 RepID=A0AAP2CUA5_9RHOB|nr:hypothetical protein [Harenicola maris]